jgi:hypothetical protein
MIGWFVQYEEEKMRLRAEGKLPGQPNDDSANDEAN